MTKKDKVKFSEILKKAETLCGLEPQEASYLLQCYNNQSIEEVLDLSRKIKENIYGKRIVFFAPLYITNYCKNNCLYCGFNSSNHKITRKRLSQNELIAEVKTLIDMGVKRILMVASEDPLMNIDSFCEAIDLCYAQKTEKGEIRRINVNIAPLTKEGFTKLKQVHIGTYQVFQETYNKKAYDTYHKSGPKKDFKFRYEAPFRAIEAGIDDIGMGVLFGLSDPVAEVKSLLEHILEMKNRYNIGPHTISVPRIKPALGSDLSFLPPYIVDDDFFAYIIAILRISVPYTGIILSTRETQSLRNQLFEIGVSQISAYSSTSPGGYSNRDDKGEQFSISDKRNIKDVIFSLVSKDLLPSFCTACYRKGRTGEVFMELAAHGKIKDFCHKNALLSFAEYIANFTDGDEREYLKSQLIKFMPKTSVKKMNNKIQKIFEGERDIYF